MHIRPGITLFPSQLHRVTDHCEAIETSSRRDRLERNLVTDKGGVRLWPGIVLDLLERVYVLDVADSLEHVNAGKRTKYASLLSVLVPKPVMALGLAFGARGLMCAGMRRAAKETGLTDGDLGWLVARTTELPKPFFKIDYHLGKGQFLGQTPCKSMVASFFFNQTPIHLFCITSAFARPLLWLGHFWSFYAFKYIMNE